jgi:hypothetical protein
MGLEQCEHAGTPEVYHDVRVASAAADSGRASILVSRTQVERLWSHTRLASHAFNSDSLRVPRQGLEITYVGRQHGCTWLGLSNDNSVDSGPSARPTP